MSSRGSKGGGGKCTKDHWQDCALQWGVLWCNHEAHRLRGHLGVERTWMAISPKYFNITQWMVQAYCATCHICTAKNPVITAFKWANKPIMSHSWRDHFQKFPQKKVYGITMRWIMTVNDHSTGLKAVFALPRKCVKYTAHEVDKYFGLVCVYNNLLFS